MAEHEVRVSYETRVRRLHSKTRTGCGNCKKRRIKCDERKPECANCGKHRVRCDFARMQDVIASAEILPSVSVDANHSESRPYPKESHLPRLDVNDGHQSAHQISAKEITHLELLHNYSTLTSLTLTEDPMLKDMWRISVPQVGFSNTCVMRSIFALSALHMSFSSAGERKKYLEVARCEHTAALQEIAAALSILNAENCSAVYIAAVLTFFYTWASPHQEDGVFLARDVGPTEWVSSLMGVNGIFRTWRANLCRGPFSLLFQLSTTIDRMIPDLRTSTFWMSSTERIQLNSLRRTIDSAAQTVQAATVYHKSLDVLETCFCITFSSPNKSTREVSNAAMLFELPSNNSTPAAATTIVHWWLWRMEDEFMKLLDRRDPIALVIFCHGCILFKSVSSRWWMQGWLSSPLQETWNILEEDQKLWIRWPVEEIGVSVT